MRQLWRKGAGEEFASPLAGAAVSGEDLVKTYGEGSGAVHALRGVSIHCEPGSFTAITGPSGSGKSTLMHLLAGLDVPDAGRVELAGVALADLSDDELTRWRRRHVGFVFQAFNLLPALSVEDNLLLPSRIAREGVDSEWVETLIAACGIGERLEHRPAELSGGEQQRLAVARALVLRPSVIFADEPTGSVDSAAGEVLLDLLSRAASEWGRTVVLVTHDTHAARRATRRVDLHDGQRVG